MGLQKELIGGVMCVSDTTNPGVPVTNLSGDGGDIIAYNANVLREMRADRLQITSANTTLYLAPDGDDDNTGLTADSPWATIAKALDHLDRFWISPTKSVTIQLADGAYSFTESIEVSHPCSRNIIFTGANAYTKAMSSVQSSSGSSGAWAVVLNLDTVTNIAVGDYVLVKSVSGGTNPTYIAGGPWEVTNVDSGNNRITISVKARTSGTASGAVTATVTVLKTVVAFTGCNGVTARNGGLIGGIHKLALIGPGTTYHGLYATGGGVLLGGSSIGVANWGDGAYCESYSNIIASGLCAGGNSGVGIYANTFGTIISPYAISSGNGSYGLQNSGGQLDAGFGTAVGNGGTGCWAGYDASSQCYSLVSNANGGFGIYAQGSSYVFANSYAATGNTSGTLSPAANTLGNQNAFINT